MTFIKNHWFGFLLSLFVSFFILVFVLVLISPKQDVQKRGFTICSENFVDEVSLCQKSYGCVLKAVLGHGYCTAKTVVVGAENWILGEQQTPWGNYMFSPQSLANEEMDEELKLFYHENPNLAEQMNDFRKKNKELKIDEEE
ncbi:MAG: hypothetical protein ACK5N8_02450 [Alphaproteobacteria bacterium]